MQNGSKRSVVPVYSREDIREQYCINDKELQVLDSKKKKGILGCFSDNGTSGISPCSKHAKRCEMMFFSDKCYITKPQRNTRHLFFSRKVHPDLLYWEVRQRGRPEPGCEETHQPGSGRHHLDWSWRSQD